MDYKRMVVWIVAIVILGPILLGPLATGCMRHQERPAPIGTVNGPAVNVTSSFGGGNNVVITPILCTGKVLLAQGSATVNDSCFTGDTNIVICSDVTSVSAARCQPGKGALRVEGNGSDTIAYARVR